MKILKYIVFFILIVVIGGSLYVATLNGNFDIKESRTIKAPVEVVFNTVNDYKNWQNWGPWYELDSTIVASFPENTSGVGASYSWTGKEGQGYIKTDSVIPNKRIVQEIDFGTSSKPTVYWNFEKTGDSTLVTWGMRGTNSFGEKLYWLFNDGIEKNMLPMYNRGLELLNKYIVKEMAKHTIEDKGPVDFGGGFYLYLTTSCKIDEIGEKMRTMFPVISQYMAENSIENAGKPFTIVHKWDEENKAVMFSTCIPVKDRVITTGDVLTGYINPEKTYKTILKGNYSYLKQTWETAYNNIGKQGFTPVPNGEPFEVYAVGPEDSANPADWVTEIYIPIN